MMSESISICVETQDSSALSTQNNTVVANFHRDTPYLSRKLSFPNKERIIRQRSSSSVALKEDATYFSLQKSNSCLSLRKNDILCPQKDVEIHVPGMSPNTQGNRQVSISFAECRVCQEEDDISNLESPCACAGSLKFAHRNCVQRWCNEKGDTTCEICRKPYEGGYTAPPSTVRLGSFPINISDSWEIASGHRYDLHEPTIFTVSSEHLFSEAEYEEYARANERSAVCFRTVALILMILLLLRHILSVTATGAVDDGSTFLMLFLLRTAGFFLPCYIIARALNALHRRQQRRDSALAAAEVAYLLQNRQAQGVHIAVSPGLLA
ncbi:hypothetical protein KP509_11G023000 [Ceratopteris richardii]|uniref:RING-CH-type domain-containing protein n=1 Tax=Ceratopteris richardii TaxID=49495 RepID=A0A8T2TSP3_CERRI|nr:hypothetical protein KP509_11G023000 [Ceratopteris richardii]